MTSLTREVSQLIVGELLTAYPAEKVSEMLAIGPARLKAFLTGRACLGFDRLDRIRQVTSKSWRQWLVAGTERLTGVQDAMNKATRQLVEELDEIETSTRKTAPVKRTPRPVAV